MFGVSVLRVGEERGDMQMRNYDGEDITERDIVFEAEEARRENDDAHMPEDGKVDRFLLRLRDFLINQLHQLIPMPNH